jgi:DNA-binding NarL/FixJ family response regulator
MGPQQIILANEPRLLRKLLRRALEKVPGLRVVGEVANLDELPRAVEQANPQWMVVPLWQPGGLPGAIKAILSEHPSLRVMGMAANGSSVAIKQAGSKETPLRNLSLDDLLAILLGGSLKPGRSSGSSDCQEPARGR